MMNQDALFRPPFDKGGGAKRWGDYAFEKVPNYPNISLK